MYSTLGILNSYYTYRFQFCQALFHLWNFTRNNKHKFKKRLDKPVNQYYNTKYDGKHILKTSIK